MENKNYPLKTALVMTAGMGLLYIWANYKLIWNQFKLLTNYPLRHKTIRLIGHHLYECDKVVDLLKKHCNTCQVLGFDCEWVSVGGKRRPVALLQLSSHEGLCALFRLSCMQQVPQSLRELLENENIVKVGVAAHDDAQKLNFDYGVGTVSTFDLRYLAAMVGHKPEGISGLAQSLLGVELDKNWRLACSNWEAKELSENQINYAANDALVAVEVFKKLAHKFNKRIRWRHKNKELNELLQQLEPYYDMRYKGSFNKLFASGQKTNLNVNTAHNFKPNCRPANTTHTRGYVTRTKPLYDNCMLEAPDGALLANISRNKAQWYINQELAKEVPSNKGFAVRLKFQPSGRGVGDEGLYYQLEKDNRCVVCGHSDVYLRKNIVPREYRKHFPIHIKSHTSHDVLLLCPDCHQRSNLTDLHLRMRLAKQCNAPLSHETAVKYYEVHELRTVKSAARALLNSYEKIPMARLLELENLIRTHYGLSENDSVFEVLEEATHMDTQRVNNKYVEHGCKVVDTYITKEFGGIFELQKLWREHFLRTMQPQYLPAMWNVNHNANR